MANSCNQGCRASGAIKLHKSGMADCQAGNLELALQKLQQALSEIRQIGLQGYQVKILNNIGIVFELMGNKPRARAHYREALGLARVKLSDQAKLSRLVGANLARLS